jgi:hypothetical protein
MYSRPEQTLLKQLLFANGKGRLGYGSLLLSLYAGTVGTWVYAGTLARSIEEYLYQLMRVVNTLQEKASGGSAFAKEKILQHCMHAKLLDLYVEECPDVQWTYCAGGGDCGAVRER